MRCKDILPGEEYAVRSTSSIIRMIAKGPSKRRGYVVMTRPGGWDQTEGCEDVLRTWEQHQAEKRQMKRNAEVLGSVLEESFQGVPGLRVIPRPQSAELELRLEPAAMEHLTRLLHLTAREPGEESSALESLLRDESSAAAE